MRKTSLTLIAFAILLWVGAVFAQTAPSLMCPPPVGPLAGDQPRYQDNKDGTITDHQTGLMWEKKTGEVSVAPNAPNVHDVNNRYTWSSAGSTDPDGTLFAQFLGTFNHGISKNGRAVTGCFANYCDWRLPSIVELQGIVDQTACAGGACIDPIFAPTQRRFYWSGSSVASSDDAWGVDFSLGVPETNDKHASFFVRAVRCGLVRSDLR